jgi:hypothetical protein
MHNNNIDFTKIIPQFEALNAPRNYWMVRTMGGAYYGDFVRNGYTAIGFDEITLDYLRQLPTNPNDAKEKLKPIIAANYEGISQYGYYASQILHFYRDMKEGDVVIIPSTGAAHIAIGIVKSSVYEETSPVLDTEHVCKFKKRRTIAWKVYCRRSNLPPALQFVFNSRHPVSNVSNYAPYIDSLLNDCYYKDEKMHLVLRIKTRNDVTMDDFFCFSQIKQMAEQICADAGYPIDDPIVIKIQMESPGWCRLSTKCIMGLLVVGLIVVGISGGGIRCSRKNGLDVHTDGLLYAVSDYLDRHAERELVESIARSLDSLKVDSVKDIEPYLELLKHKKGLE